MSVKDLYFANSYWTPETILKIDDYTGLACEMAQKYGDCRVLCFYGNTIITY